MSKKLLAPAQHETSDVDPAFIWIGVPLVLVSVIALALLVLWLYPSAIGDRRSRFLLPQYPNPRLQTSPRDTMAAFYADEMQRLNGTGWIDKSKGIVHIPIGDAMRKIAQQGIPDWPTSQVKQP